MKRLLIIVGAIAVGLLLYLSWGHVPKTGRKDTPARPRQLTFLVFVDVTSSLDIEEIRSVGDQAAAIISAAPDGSRVVVLPIMRDIERATAIKDELIMIPATSRDMAEVQAQRRKLAADIKRNIAALAPDVNADPNQLRSCVSNALRRAAEIISGSDKDMIVEVILISDMIEECENSLEGKPVNLAREHILEDIERARTLNGKLVDLRGARVTALIPSARMPVVAPGQRKRPPVHELREYWRAILDHCGDDRSFYTLGADLPLRLRTETYR